MNEITAEDVEAGVNEAMDKALGLAPSNRLLPFTAAQIEFLRELVTQALLNVSTSAEPGGGASMNIFETIGRVSRRIEPYHSRFLAEALQYSLKGDRSLFNAVWELAAPQDWETPEQATVFPEAEVAEDAIAGRIDILIRTEHPARRILGIEVKTSDGSVDPGQLEKYRKGLKDKHSDSVEISFLTPFNRERASEEADSLNSVKEFEKFAKSFPRSNHVSWLDIAEIDWDDNPLWKQHQDYVRRRISSLNDLKAKREKSREFADFFGKDAADSFLEELDRLGVSVPSIDLSEFRNEPRFAESLASAFEILLRSDNVNRGAEKEDKFSDELRHRFLESPYRAVHEALFGLSKRFPYMWVQGKSDYGVRTAHKKHSSGVSLVRSDGPGHLLVGEKR